MTGTAPGAKPPSEDDTKATQKSRINKKSGRDGKPAGEWAAENNIGNGPNRFLPAGAPALAAAKGKIRARPAPVSPRGPLCGKKGIEFFEFFSSPGIDPGFSCPKATSRPVPLRRIIPAITSGFGRRRAQRRSGFALIFPIVKQGNFDDRGHPDGPMRGAAARQPTPAPKTGQGKPAAENEKFDDEPQNKAANRGAIFRAKPEEQKKAKEAKEKTPGRAKRATRWRSRAAPSIIRGIVLIRIPVGLGQTLFAQGRLLRILGVLERFHGRQAHVQPRGCERLGFELGGGQPL